MSAAAAFARRLLRPPTPTSIAVFVLVAATTLMALCVNPRLTRFMTLAYAVIIACGLLLARRSLPLGLLWIWAGIVCAVHPATNCIAALAIITFGVGLLYITRLPEGSLYRMADAVCIIAMIHVAWQILQATGRSPLFGGLAGDHQLFGLMGNVNDTSAFMAVCLPAFFRRSWLWLLPVPIAGLFMAQSTCGILAGTISAIAALTIAGAQTGRRLLTTLLALSVIAGSIGYVVVWDKFHWSSHRDSRLMVWQDTWQASLRKPWFGWGFGQFSAVMPLVTAPKAMVSEARKILFLEIEDRRAFTDVVIAASGGEVERYYNAKNLPVMAPLEAHNEYLELLFAAGFPGLFLLLWAAADLLRQGFYWCSSCRLSALRVTGALGLLSSTITALVFFSWQVVPVAAVTAVWAGLCLRERNKESVL